MVSPRSTRLPAVFPSEEAAFKYLLDFAKHDLQMRGFRDERTAAFVEKQRANFLLRQRVQDCRDDIEFERWRQHWIEHNRPKAIVIDAEPFCIVSSATSWREPCA